MTVSQLSDAMSLEEYFEWQSHDMWKSEAIKAAREEAAEEEKYGPNVSYEQWAADYALAQEQAGQEVEG